MTETFSRTPLPGAELVYLAGSGLELAHPDDDVRGLPVVTPYGIRLGEVDDLVVDRQDRRARLLSVLSGGILGLGATERLVPVEAITGVDERVRVDRSHVDDAYPGRPAGDLSGDPTGPRGNDGDSATGTAAFADVYERYGVIPFWSPDYAEPTFLRH